MVGTTVFGDDPRPQPADADPPPPAAADAERIADEFAKSKFATQPTLVFKAGGPAVFAWQVKPAPCPATARERDIAGHGGHLRQPGRRAAQAGPADHRPRLAQTAGADDRIDVWTVNLDHAGRHPVADRRVQAGQRRGGAERGGRR